MFMVVVVAILALQALLVVISLFNMAMNRAMLQQILDWTSLLVPTLNDINRRLYPRLHNGLDIINKAPNEQNRYG